MYFFNHAVSSSLVNSAVVKVINLVLNSIDFTASESLSEPYLIINNMC